MKKTIVFFRVDGNAQIGLGHLVRCIALAQMLKSEFEIHFICRSIPEGVEKDINELTFKLTIIDDENDFLSLLITEAIVVLDHYDLDSAYQKNIKNVGCKLVCIDDMHDKLFYADLIINHAPNISVSDYQAQNYTQYALGLKYALLRPAFFNKTKQFDDSGIIQSAFVCFGGSDSKNITQLVVDILKADVRFKKIIVVVGVAYNYLNELKQSLITDSRFYLYNAINPETMSNLIVEADLAIVPSSGILQEVLAIGCKVISGMYVENQRNIFDNYKALGAFKSAESFAKEDLVKAINESFKSDNSATKKFIDGKSDERLLEQFILLEK